MSKSLFDVQVDRYKAGFERMTSKLNPQTVVNMGKLYGIMPENMRHEFDNNTDAFQSFCYKYAGTQVTGNVSCVAYAAVVSAIARHLGVDHKVYAGACLRRSMGAFFERNKAQYDAAKAIGKEHPIAANHVYVVVDGRYYECYCGDTDSILHLDEVQIA